jgi:DCN1-like protein 1/2
LGFPPCSWLRSHMQRFKPHASQALTPLAPLYHHPPQKNQKCLQLDVAVGMWQLLFAEDRAWQYADDWCEFLQRHHNRAISRDTWVQLFEFARTVKADFSNFDESAAWPYL